MACDTWFRHFPRDWPLRFRRINSQHFPVLFTAFACCASGLQQQAQAQSVVAVVTGTVTSGIDTNGTFGPAGASLIRQPITLTYTLVPSSGRLILESCASQGPPYCGSLQQWFNGSAVGSSVVISIGSGSTTLTPSATVGAAQAARYIAGDGAAIIFQIQLDSNTFADASLAPASSSPPWTTDYNWYDAFNYPGPLVEGSGGSNQVFLDNLNTYINFDANALTVSGLAPSGNEPRIIRDGTTDITNTTQSAIVGQLIALTASLPPGASLAAGQPWSVDGSIVGGYQVSQFFAATAQTVNANLTTQSIFFYWTAPSPPTGFTVTLNCVLSTGEAATVSASFYLDGPTSPNVTTTIGIVKLVLTSG